MDLHKYENIHYYNLLVFLLLLNNNDISILKQFKLFYINIHILRKYIFKNKTMNLIKFIIKEEPNSTYQNLSLNFNIELKR